MKILVTKCILTVFKPLSNDILVYVVFTWFLCWNDKSKSDLSMQFPQMDFFPKMYL